MFADGAGKAKGENPEDMGRYSDSNPTQTPAASHFATAWRYLQRPVTSCSVNGGRHIAEEEPMIPAHTALPSQAFERLEHTRSFAVELLGDTGAGETVGSAKALKAQGIPSDVIEKLHELTTAPLRFSTGGGTQEANKQVGLWNDALEKLNMFLLNYCP